MTDLDFSPHPLVTALAHGLSDDTSVLTQALAAAFATAQAAAGGAPAAAAAPAGGAPAAVDDAARRLVYAFLQESNLPELVTFSGYVAGIVDNGSGSSKTEWLQLYLDGKLRTWLLIEKGGIVLRGAIEDKAALGGQRDVIWAKADASVKRGSGTQPARSRFLSGEFTSAGNFSASLTGGTVSAATGIFCDAQTPGCCGRPTRP
jgi:hypothetical protein